MTRVFEEHHQSEVGILNEGFAEREIVIEQQNSLLQDELWAAESAIRKEKAAKKDAPLLGDTAPPPGLRAAFEQAPERQAKPPPSPFEVPVRMKNFLHRLSNSPSITGLASPPTPSAAPKGQPVFFRLKQLLLPA